jgi:hypothetical protein
MTSQSSGLMPWRSNAARRHSGSCVVGEAALAAQLREIILDEAAPPGLEPFVHAGDAQHVVGQHLRPARAVAFRRTSATGRQRPRRVARAGGEIDREPAVLGVERVQLLQIAHQHVGRGSAFILRAKTLVLTSAIDVICAEPSSAEAARRGCRAARSIAALEPREQPVALGQHRHGEVAVHVAPHALGVELGRRRAVDRAGVDRVAVGGDAVGAVDRALPARRRVGPELLHEGDVARHSVDVAHDRLERIAVAVFGGDSAATPRRP